MRRATWYDDCWVLGTRAARTVFVRFHEYPNMTIMFTDGVRRRTWRTIRAFAAAHPDPIQSPRRAARRRHARQTKRR
jgi:hypothetical protein